MRSFSYFSILVLGTYFGYQAIGIAKLYLWVGILENFGSPSPTVSKIIIYLLSVPGWAFTLFVIFRVYVCLKQKQIVIPQSYTGMYYTIGLVIASLSLLAFLGTVVSSLGLPAGGVSGVPLAMVLLPIGVVSVVLMLRFEIPEIRGRLRNAS